MSPLISRQIRDDWLLASRGYFLGCVPVRLEEAVSTREGRTVLMAAIKSLIKALLDTPEMLDHSTLNLLGFEDRQFNSDLESRRLIQVGEAFLALIDGKIQSDASSTEFMPGSRPAT